MTEREPATKPVADYAAVLRNRNFALIWAGRAVSNLGDWLRHIALIWLVKDITGSALAMGTVTLCALVPYLVFGLFAGALVDMVDRKKVMVWSDMLRGALTLVVPTLVWTQSVHFWHLCVAAFVLSTISAFFNPAMSATIPNVVGKEHLLAANSLNSLTMQLAGVAGPALGGVIVGATGTVPALLIDSVSFLVSALAILASVVPGRAPGTAAAPQATGLGTILAGVKEGFGFIAGRRLLLAIVLVAVGLNFIGAPTMILTAIHVDKAWGAGAEGYGMINSAWSLGALLGTLLVAAAVARIKRDDVISGALALQGLAMFGLVFGPSLAYGIAVFTLMGVCNSLINIPLLTWAQQVVPDRVRGRVFSAVEVGCQLAAPIALAMAGSAADAFGTVAIFAFMAVTTILGGLALKWVFVTYGAESACFSDMTSPSPL